MALTREQQQVLNALLGAGQSIKDPRTRRVYERAAVQTGLVESGLRNLSYGDADSQGWRQERRSLYADPMNLQASAGRFRDEFLEKYTPGARSWDVAAAVQRPAAHLRGRYREEAGEAASILREYGGTGATGGSSSTPAAQPTGQQQSVDPAALLSMLQPQQQRQQPQGTGNLPTPAAIAGPALPSAYKALSAGQAPAARQGLDSAALVAMTSRGPDPSLAAAAAPQTAATVQAGAEGGLGGIVAEMDRIDTAKVPYLWGGGHGAKAKPGAKVTPLDCSGAVSQALGIDPLVSGQFARWGEAGKGKKVTIYANDEHVLMHVRGRGFWGTSKTNPGGGAGWIPASSVSKDYLSRFVARHPPGL